MLRCEGFTDFLNGGLSLVGGTAVEAQEGASEVFVFMTDTGSAKRLTDILRACPMRGRATGLFELYEANQGKTQLDVGRYAPLAKEKGITDQE